MSCPRGKAAPDGHTKLRLFADAAGFCQNPDCNRPLFVETASKNIHIAEMAHVFAASDEGPRADPLLTEEERGKYENLILFCPSCHAVIDKASSDFPDSMILDWKRGHVQRIAGLFGAAEYASRAEARAAIEAAMKENRTIFDRYGPENDYKENPESELAHVWQRKLLSRILPNNRRILSILDANRAHLIDVEVETVELFRQHIEDLEARHVGDNVAAVGARFPPGMSRILMDGNDA
jgi:hypothetical protein